MKRKTLYQPINPDYYSEIDAKVFNSPFFEDYEEIYGHYYKRNIKLIGKGCYSVITDSEPTTVDYNDKVVLDVGADYGSTAKFLFDKGAKRVIAVESDFECFKELWKYVESESRLTAVNLAISNRDDMTNLLTKYKPDIVKMDCEGCEVHLYNSDEETIRIPKFYIIEIHNVPLIVKSEIPNEWKQQLMLSENEMIVKENFAKLFKSRLESCGFKIVGLLEWSTDLNEFMDKRVEIIFAERVDND